MTDRQLRQDLELRMVRIAIRLCHIPRQRLLDLGLRLENLVSHGIFPVLNPEVGAKCRKLRSDTEQVRSLDHLPLNEVLKQDLNVCVVDYSQADLRINFVEYLLFQALFQFMSKKDSSGKAPVFRSNEKFRGYKVIVCDCESSVEFLRNCIEKG